MTSFYNFINTNYNTHRWNANTLNDPIYLNNIKNDEVIVMMIIKFMINISNTNINNISVTLLYKLKSQLMQHLKYKWSKNSLGDFLALLIIMK